MRKNTLTAILGALAIISVVPAARAEIASKEYVDNQKNTIISGTDAQQLAGIAEEAGASVQEMVDAVNQVGLAGVGGAAVIARNRAESKQDKLGGESEAGKVVTATGTAGTVSYTAIDSTPTAESANLVSSGGVAAAIGAVGAGTQEIRDALTELSVAYGDSLGASVSRYGQSGNKFLVTDNSGYVRPADNINLGKIDFPTPPTACMTQGCMLMFYNGQYIWEPITRDANEIIATTGAKTGSDSTNSVYSPTVSTSLNISATRNYVNRHCEIDAETGEAGYCDVLTEMGGD